MHVNLLEDDAPPQPPQKQCCRSIGDVFKYQIKSGTHADYTIHNLRTLGIIECAVSAAIFIASVLLHYFQKKPLNKPI